MTAMRAPIMPAAVPIVSTRLDAGGQAQVWRELAAEYAERYGLDHPVTRACAAKAKTLATFSHSPGCKRLDEERWPWVREL